MDNLSNSEDSAPEEITFSAAKKTKLKVSSIKPKIKKKPKIVNHIAEQLKLAIDEKLPSKTLKELDKNQKYKEKTDKNKPSELLKQSESLIKTTKTINKRITLVYQDIKRPLNKLNRNFIDYKKKHFFEEKARVPLSEIIQK